MSSIKNYTKNDIIKKLFLFANNNIRSLMISSDKFICSPTFLKKNEIITNNYRELMEMIFSEEFNKDINIVKKMTDASLPSQNKNSEKYHMNFIEKIGYYLKLFFKIETALKFRRKLKLKKRQEIFIPKSITNNIYTIKPHQKLKIGPIYYNPNNSSNYSATLFIKNNLTILYPIKVMGMGGSGVLEIYSMETDDKVIEKKIEKLLINIDSHTALSQIERNNDLIIKTIKLKNTGNLPLKIYNISIENLGCNGHGISLSMCTEIILNPKEFVNLNFTIKPNFNFYLTEKNIIFHTHYHKMNFKININISDEVLASRNSLFIYNFGDISFLVIAFIIILILLILSREYNDFNYDSFHKSIIFISPKEIIEKNPVLKIENLLLKTYRRINKKIYDDFNIKQYTTINTFPNPTLDIEKKKSFSSKRDSKESTTASNRKERAKTEENLSYEKKSEIKVNDFTENKDIIDQNKAINSNLHNSVNHNSQSSVTQNISNKTITTQSITSKKNAKPIIDKKKPKPVGLKQDKVEKVTPEFSQTQPVKPTTTVPPEIKTNTEYIQAPQINKENSIYNYRYSSKEDYNYIPNSTYNQGTNNQDSQANSIYTSNYRNYAFNKFSYSKIQERPYIRGQVIINEIQGFNPNINSTNNQQGFHQSNQQINPVQNKLEINNINSENNIENKQIENIFIPKEETSKIHENYDEKKIEADQLREQFNNFQMGFKLGGESTSNIQANEQIISSNTKSDVVEKHNNEEICISSSEIDEEKNLKLLNLCDDDSLHYQSEKEKIYEESGTEDKREDIKLNFNSIFGYHSNVKIITNDEKDQIEEENTEKEENNFGGLYFNEKFFTNFDKVFKKPDPFGFNVGLNVNSNPFVSDNNKVSALNELRDDEDDKFKLDSLIDDKHCKVDELEIEDDDEKDPEWDDDNMDMKKEGFFDETGTYKLKQIDFNFDLDMKRIKR